MTDEKIALPNFEKALKELHEIVEKMEQGGLPLDKSLAYFERGINLTRQCQTLLQEAEQKVQILSQQNGKSTPKDFDIKDED